MCVSVTRVALASPRLSPAKALRNLLGDTLGGQPKSGFLEQGAHGVRDGLRGDLLGQQATSCSAVDERLRVQGF
jgi:hypothetical protein